jgi:Uma2 family endonuclease
LWQFQERVELIKGFVIKMSPAPSSRNQGISHNLNGCFYINFHKKPCRVFVAPFDVRLPIKSDMKETTVVQPDLCVICHESKIDKRGCNGSPDLVVEIISPGNSKHDIHTKFNLYQEAAVKEYWIIVPEERTIFIYTLSNGKYVGLKPLVEGEDIVSPLFPELVISVEDVFTECKNTLIVKIEKSHLVMKQDGIFYILNLI